jgi:hypothetical protein
MLNYYISVLQETWFVVMVHYNNKGLVIMQRKACYKHHRYSRLQRR